MYYYDCFSRLPDSKLMSLDTDSDGLNLLHKISQQKLSPFIFNDLRPYILAQKYEFQQDKLNVIFSIIIYLKNKMMPTQIV